MPFLKGKVTFTRFKPSLPPPDLFTDDHLASLATLAIGKRPAAADGSLVGWTAGDHEDDEGFGCGKNVVGSDFLLWDLCTEVDKIPTKELRKAVAIELKAFNLEPGKEATAKQKREAKEAALARLEEKAADGRWKRRQTVPVCWDRGTNTVFVGSTSSKAAEAVCGLWGDTFGGSLIPVNPASLAFDAFPVTGSDGDHKPAFCDDIAWMAHGGDHGFLGNEFLLWLWYTTAELTDTLTLADGSDLTFMFSRTLKLECPRGQGGADAFSHEGPTRMPEALRAIRAGKLPRSAGLTLVRHDSQYELTLQAETFGVTGAKLPQPEGDRGADARVARLESIRELTATLDLAYGAFLGVRLGGEWAGVVGRMKAWLGGGAEGVAA